MCEVHQHPDGLVYIRLGRDDVHYVDTPINLSIDSGVTLPELPLWAIERIYTQNKRHTIHGENGLIEGGPMTWDLGDKLIEMLPDLLLKQKRRIEAEEKAILDAIPPPKQLTAEEKFKSLNLTKEEILIFLGLKK